MQSRSLIAWLLADGTTKGDSPCDLFALLTLLASVGLADTAKTANGTVSGTVEEGIAIYRGIPFAALLDGDLCWRAPQPVPLSIDFRTDRLYTCMLLCWWFH